MKKIFVFLLVAFLFQNKAKAQYISIPDANFANWLQTNHPNCMNGNQLDTTCADLANQTSIFFNQVTMVNLTGIQYFPNLDSLTCASCDLFTLPNLQNSLSYLSIPDNPIYSIASLPQGLSYFNSEHCSYLSALPTLPPNLTYLNCSNNNALTSLPALPNDLIELKCSSSYNIDSLPNLPNNLKILDVSNCNISAIPSFPNSLIKLWVGINNLTSLPTLPNSITNLDCGYNLIPGLPVLPNSLSFFNCDNNPLLNLPSLPNSLRILYCRNNNLDSLPTLPNKLLALHGGNNNLTILPNMPDSLINLDIPFNQFTTLPVLSDTLRILNCGNNLLTSLPLLPSSMYALFCNNNQIPCLPNLPNTLVNSAYLNIANNPITCLPNYVPAMDSATLSMPLCMNFDPFNNPNSCASAQGISGYAYRDSTNNCLFESTESGIKNIPLKIYDNNNNFLGLSYSALNGIYGFPYPAGTYTVEIDTLDKPYQVNCSQPGIDSIVTLTANAPLLSNLNFDVACKPGFDIGIQSTCNVGFLTPNHHYIPNIVAGDLSDWYGLGCAAGISGQVIITVTGPVSYISPAPGALTPVVSGNIFTYNIADFANVNLNHDFKIIFNVDTTAQLGDLICVNVNVTPLAGDIDNNNNNLQFCNVVQTSFDPNMKEVYPLDVVAPYNDWFTYTIHFQNTGTVPAENVRLLDTLDSNLDKSTFELINYSHPNTTMIINNVLDARFINIYLPDSTSNLEASKGFIQYRIKPLQNLPVGAQISNNCDIFFDYNTSIKTNTTHNNFTAVTGLSALQNREKEEVKVFPNPGTGLFNIKFLTIDDRTITVYSMMGDIVSNTRTSGQNVIIDLNHESAGIYFISISGSRQTSYERLIKIN